MDSKYTAKHLALDVRNQNIKKKEKKNENKGSRYFEHGNNAI
jgi:hypothetical protein